MSTTIIRRKRQSPFTKFKKWWGFTENTVIALLLATGHTDSSMAMLLFKIGSSYLMNSLELIFH